ncbi:DUF4157 domain-containing protein [Streptomyces sp. NPDC056169]|uniref:eCIS core domain-containing protein n=1 Tax=Streptomyces sp. NPDC056169 TaxID=3345734 RepID=UPI0035D57B94
MHAHSHDHENAKATEAGGGRASSRRGTGPVPPARLLGLMGLQATAGNEAVVQLLREAGHAPAQPEQHQHGAGCGHPNDPPAVQRSTVPDVLRASGRPLDEATRSDMEARLGADFGDVRVHDDSAARASAEEVGARAYTSGSHVVLGAGGSDRHTLAHELTHVIQQRQGPVAGTDNGSGLKVSDPSDRFEREAEANAARALAAPAPGRAPTAPDAHDESRESQAPRDGAVQRAIDTGLTVYDGTEGKTVDDLPWQANEKEFFTFSKKVGKDKWSIRPGNADDLAKVQNRLFTKLQELVLDEETYSAKSADLLAQLVKDQLGKPVVASSAGRQSGAGAGGQESGPPTHVLEVAAELAAMGARAFPQDEIAALAAKARPGNGWLYELEMGLKELKADPQCVVQFGSCTQADINHALGRASGATGQGVHIASFVADPRTKSSKTGADWVVWRPVPQDTSESASAPTPTKYTGEFVQAKQTVARNFKTNLKAAAFQLEGKNASGAGSAQTERELTLRSRSQGDHQHMGTIAMQVTDEIGREQQAIVRHISDELKTTMDKKTKKRPYVDRVIVEESMAAGERTLYELVDGSLTTTSLGPVAGSVGE